MIVAPPNENYTIVGEFAGISLFFSLSTLLLTAHLLVPYVYHTITSVILIRTDLPNYISAISKTSVKEKYRKEGSYFCKGVRIEKEGWGRVVGEG